MKTVFALLPFLFLVGCSSPQVLFDAGAEPKIRDNIESAAVSNEAALPDDFDLPQSEWKNRLPLYDKAFRDELARANGFGKGPALVIVTITNQSVGSYAAFSGVTPAWIAGELIITRGPEVLYSATFTAQSGRDWGCASLDGRMESAYRALARALIEKLDRDYRD